MENLQIKNLEDLTLEDCLQVDGGVKGPDGCITDPFKDILDSLGKRSSDGMINL